MIVKDFSVVTVMAVYKPDLEMLRTQIESILNQDFVDSRLIVMVDSTEKISIESDFKENPKVRFFYGERKNVYLNFERALKIALSDPKVSHICFSDQDDYWFSSKISKLLEVAYASQKALIHSNLLLDQKNTPGLAKDVWQYEKRSSLSGPIDLFIRNSVTGSSMLINRELASASLPFPRQVEGRLLWHHDLWIAMLAAGTGKFGIALVPLPLGSYRQHGGNVVGAVQGVYEPKKFSQAVIDYVGRRRLVHATVDRLSELQLNSRIFLTILNSPFAILILFCRAIIFFLTWNPEKKLVWKLLIGSVINVPISLMRRGFSLVLAIKSKVYILLKNIKSEVLSSELRGCINSVESIEQRVVFSQLSLNPTVYIFIPTIRESSLFGGIQTALNFGLCLSELGHKVKIITTDIKTPTLSQSSELELIRRLGRKTTNSNFEVVSTNDPVVIGKNDLLIATAWWTMRSLKELKTVYPQITLGYLIQDFEPGFSAWGENYANALSTYEGDYIPIINSELLSDYLSENLTRRIESPIVFRPQYIKIESTKRAYNKRRSIEIFFYSRPSVERNMYQLGIKVLWKLGEWALTNNVQLKVHLAGEKISGVRIPGLDIVVHGKMKQKDYVELLQKIDIGMSLMFSPHPSYVPLEIASAGAWSLSNSCFNKIKGSLGPGIILVPTEVEHLLSEMKALVGLVQTNKFPLPPKDFKNLGVTIEDASKTLINHYKSDKSSSKK